MSWFTRFRACLAARDRAVSVVGGIDFARTPDPAWQTMLDRTHIPGTARLTVAWEAGDRWQPIHRWMVWQLQPWAHVDRAFQQELRGPHPRTDASLSYVPAVVDGVRQLRPRIHGGPCRLIDRASYELHWRWFRQTGELVRPRRLWVVQGAHGGHPFAVTMAEEKRRRSVGLTPDVPSAGDLPYVEFDGRVLTALARYDLWRYAHGLGDPITNGAALAIAQLQATECEAHTAQWAQLLTMGEEWADAGAFAARQDGLHRLRTTPVGHRGRTADLDRARDAFINDYSVELTA